MLGTVASFMLDNSYLVNDVMDTNVILTLGQNAYTALHTLYYMWYYLSPVVLACKCLTHSIIIIGPVTICFCHMPGHLVIDFFFYLLDNCINLLTVAGKGFLDYTGSLIRTLRK